MDYIDALLVKLTFEQDSLSCTLSTAAVCQKYSISETGAGARLSLELLSIPSQRPSGQSRILIPLPTRRRKQATSPKALLLLRPYDEQCLDIGQIGHISETRINHATNKAVPVYTCCPQNVAKTPLAAPLCGTDTTSSTKVWHRNH